MTRTSKQSSGWTTLVVLGALTFTTLTAGQAAAVVNPVDPSEDTLCAVLVDTVDNPVWAACVKTKLSVTGIDCSGTGADYECTVHLAADARLIGAAPTENIGLYMHYKDSEGNEFGNGGGAWMRPPGSFLGTGFTDRPVTYSNIGPDGTDVSLDVTQCIGQGYQGEEAVQCETWTALTYHLPAEGSS